MADVFNAPALTPPRAFLDHAAGAPLLPAARDALLAHLADEGANPDSAHREGQRARALLEESRDRVALTLGVHPRSVVFTSGATEALRIGLVGAAEARREASRRILVSALEHGAVEAAAASLETRGFEVVRVPATPDGVLDLNRLVEALRLGAAVGAFAPAHHETGVLQPLGEVARLLAAAGVPLLVDASLAPGRMAATPDSLGAPLVAYSASKFGGGAGMGWLHVRRGMRLANSPSAAGTSEEGLRGGSLPVAAIHAAAIAMHEASIGAIASIAWTTNWIDALRRHLIAARLPTNIAFEQQARLPGFALLELHAAHGEAVATSLDLAGFAVSTGAPCALGGRDPSPGLLALGWNAQRASSTIRISLGGTHAPCAVDVFCAALQQILERLQRLAGTAHPMGG